MGDRVLRKLSNELKNNLRTEDLVGRYGADEFCVILPDRSLVQAQEIMERLNQVFSEYQQADEPQLCANLGIGLTSCRTEYQDTPMWLNEADKALYIAKNIGRNKVSIGAADTLMDSVLSKP